MKKVGKKYNNHLGDWQFEDKPSGPVSCTLCPVKTGEITTVSPFRSFFTCTDVIFR